MLTPNNKQQQSIIGGEARNEKLSLRLRSQKTKLESGNGTLKIIPWELNFPVKYKVILEESEVNSVQKVNTELTKPKVYSTFD